MPKTQFEGKDIFALQFASDPQIQHDGKLIAYVRNGFDVMSDRRTRAIWLIDSASGTESPLLSGPANYGLPRWSPDGGRLAYVSTAEGDKPQLFVRWMASGVSIKIATLPHAPRAVLWAPDGRHIAFLMVAPEDPPKLGTAPAKPEGAKWAEPLKVIDEVVYRSDGGGYNDPGHTQLYIVPSSGGTPRQLTNGPAFLSGPLSFSSDGKRILFASNRSKNWQRESGLDSIYAVDVETSALSELTKPGPNSDPQASPDGARIAYLSFVDQQKGFADRRLYVMARDGKDAHAVTPGFDRSFDQIEWAQDGRSVFASYADRGITRIARVDLDGKVTPLVEGLGGAGEIDRPYSGGEFSASKAGALAFTSIARDRLTDISLWQDGKTRQLTHLGDEFLSTRKLGKVEDLAVVSSFDKKPIDAWMVLPPDFDATKKYPLILEIHGGPFASYGPSFSTDYQLYAAAGYVVVYGNPRGSTSYGEAFANEIDRNYPSHDYDDLMSMVDSAIAKGVIDDKHLYVTGGSGGGVLTAWIVGKTDRFRAAVSQKPVINWSSMVLTTDGSAFMTKYWFGKMPWEDPDGYWKRSPLSLAGNIKTPTLVVVGDADYRTPASESEQLYEALALRGVPTGLVKVPGANHGDLTGRPSQSAAKASAILAWFARYKD